MQKKITYLLLLIFFVGMTSFIVIRYRLKHKSSEVAFYPLQERKGAAALLPEWSATKTNGEKLIRIVRERPTDIKSTLALAALYIQEARVTGNYNYYDGAALKYIGDILEMEPRNFQALILKAILQLSQHHFSDALETAMLAQKINPYNAYVYGIMVDGNVEMGNYPAAVEYSDKMMSIRPDIRSYARVSYLREIHGDNPGAIEAMKMAVEAGGYGDEGTEWSRIQLARLYENTGDTRTAEMQYDIAFNERPGYAYAIAGLGHIAMASKNYSKAISLYESADSSLNDMALKEQLAELYGLTGQPQKASAMIKAIIDQLNKSSREGEPSLNHHADKELAYAYILNNQPAKAIEHALKEYNRRPDNIDVNEAVAWAYYKNGDIQNALPFLSTALRTHCNNPVLLLRAGIIYATAGDRIKSKSYLNKGLHSNPNLDPKLKQEAMEALIRL